METYNTVMQILIVLVVMLFIMNIVAAYFYYKVTNENRELQLQLKGKESKENFLTQVHQEGDVPLYKELFEIYQSPGNIVLTGIKCNERNDDWTTDGSRFSR